MKNIFTQALLSSLLLVTVLSTSVANAKINESSQESSLEAQIKQNINTMLGFTEAPVSQADITKEMNSAALELQTNELVRSNNEQLQKFKFKVVIAD
ncbi:MAG: hypothetical protein ABJK64_07680 [Paraglaciecola sp.]|uniref:hypothetical protein n=1 Tax=Paraglaciecola sp. TaxID=1920173 RepID=UPI0032977F20